MLTLAVMIFDLFLYASIILIIFRLSRAIWMRLSFMKKLKRICNNNKYTLKKLRSPLVSIFCKSDKIDLIVDTKENVYNVKFISSLSRKKVYHFVDANNYITYLKFYFALPMATKFNESILFLSYHKFPTVKKNNRENEKYVILFNPVPNETTHIGDDGARHVTGNGAMIEDFYVYNANGFCSFIKDGTC